MTKLTQGDLESIMSVVMDKVDYPKNYHEVNEHDLVISFGELEQILKLFIEEEDK